MMFNAKLKTNNLLLIILIILYNYIVINIFNRIHIKKTMHIYNKKINIKINILNILKILKHFKNFIK